MPITRQVIPQVEDSPFTSQRPSVRATPDAFGGGLGQGVQAAGLQMARVYERERIQADELAVLEADRKLAQWENDNIFNPEKGALTRRGKDAFGIHDEYGKALDQFVGEVDKSLASDNQRIAFRRAAGRRKLEIERRLSSHVAAERERFDDSETENYLTNSIAAAGASFDNPERAATEFARQEAAILSWAERKGLPADSELVKNRLAAARDKSHTAVLSGLLTNEMYAEARDYLQANEDDITDPDIKAQLKASVREGGLRAEAQQEEDRIMAGYGGDQAAALAAARELRPDVRDDVVSRVKARFAERESIRSQAESERNRYVTQFIRGGGKFTDLPVTLSSQLTPEQVSAAKAMEEFVRTGMPSLDSRKFADIERIKGTHPQAFMSMDLSAYEPYLSPETYRGYLREQANMRLQTTNKEARVEVTASQTFGQQFDDVAKTAGIIDAGKPLNKNDEKNLARYIALKEEAMRRLEVFEVGKRDKATPSEQRDIINKLVLKERVNIRGAIWDDENVPLYALSADDAGRTFVPLESLEQRDREFFTGVALNTVFRNIPVEQMSSAQKRQLKGIVEDAAAAAMLGQKERLWALFGGQSNYERAVKDARGR